MDEKSIFKNSFSIVFNDLKSAIKDYLDYDHTNGETKYIDAYLAATIHALMDYVDRYMKCDDEKIKACRYANNTLKHNASLMTHKEISGGFEFPMEFPSSIEKMEVVWKYDDSIKSKYENQKSAFKKHFAGKPIIETLMPIAELIDRD